MMIYETFEDPLNIRQEHTMSWKHKPETVGLYKRLDMEFETNRSATII